MRWLAAAVVAVLFAVSACTSDPRTPALTRPPAIAGRSTPGPVPAGTRPATFHGLTIFVPATWATNAVKCGAPLRNTVFFGDGAQAACGSTGRGPFTLATFRTWTPGHPDTRLTPRSLVIDGHRAIFGIGEDRATHVTELVVSDLKAELDVRSPSSAIGTRLVRTAQITRTDANGCPSTMPYVDLISPAATGPADAMVAGSPSQVVVCHYLRTYLEQGISLSATNGTHLVEALNALPSGLSEVRRSTYAAGLCRGGKLAAQGDSSDEEDFSIRLGRPGRAPSLVYARLGLCGAVGFTNGTRTGQRTEPIINLLNGFFDDALTWPGAVHPR